MGKQIPSACSVSNFKDVAYAHIGTVCLNRMKKKGYVCLRFISKIGNATSTQIYFPILVHVLKWKVDLRACSVFNFGDKA